MSLVASGILDIIQNLCRDTKIEYCPLTQNYMLYHTKKDENFILETDFFEKYEKSSFSLIIYWFDAKGSEGARKAMRTVKKKASPLWGALEGENNKDT